MKNNPLNGYQPDDELVAVADAQEHEIEHVQKPAANAAQSPETDAATVDPDTGEIIDTTDGAAAHDDDTDAAERPIHYPTCRFCGKQTIPVAPYKSDADADEAATLKCDFSDYTAARNMELAGELYDFLLNVGINVLDANIAGATIKVGRFTVKFSVGNKSALSIAFTYSDGAKLEV